MTPGWGGEEGSRWVPGTQEKPRFLRLSEKVIPASR